MEDTEQRFTEALQHLVFTALAEGLSTEVVQGNLLAMLDYLADPELTGDPE